MRKIPTVFVRDFDGDPRYCTDTVTPGCEWVFAGEGIATRKYDGTCVMITPSGAIWARREVRAGRDRPFGFVPVDSDDLTGKLMGWVPMAGSSFARYITEAVTGKETAGTYELCGPKVNGNPEHFGGHRLVRHGVHWIAHVPTTIPELRQFVRTLPFEGIVWWRDGEPMAKLKRKDIPPT